MGGVLVGRNIWVMTRSHHRLRLLLLLQELREIYQRLRPQQRHGAVWAEAREPSQSLDNNNSNNNK